MGVNKSVYSSELMYFTNDPSFQFSCIYFVLICSLHFFLFMCISLFLIQIHG